MEIIAESGVGSHSSCDVPNEVKPQTAALGFRIKSGWAAAVLLTGPIGSPALRDNRVIDLSDPRVPETRQPYHATFGQLETDSKKTNRRADIVNRVTGQSVTKLLADYRRKGYSIARACLVVGSQRDPASISNPHIRAHALEGQLFRSALEQALNTHGIQTAVLLERDVYVTAGAQLKRSGSDVRETIQNLGRSGDGHWRAEQKLAAAGAWVALGHKFALGAITR
jgi:hypothetical protein